MINNSLLPEGLLNNIEQHMTVYGMCCIYLGLQKKHQASGKLL